MPFQTFVAICFLGLLAPTLSSKPPVVTWTSANLDLPAMAAVNNFMPKQEFKEDILDKIVHATPGTNVALFIESGLSSDDFLVHGDAYGSEGVFPVLQTFLAMSTRSLVLDAVDGPVEAFDESGLAVTDVLDPSKISEALKTVNDARVNVFKIYLEVESGANRGEKLAENDATMRDVMREFQRVNRPFVGVLTGDAKDAEEEKKEEDNAVEEDEFVVHVVKKRDTPDKLQAKQAGTPITINSNCIKVYWKTMKVVLHTRGTANRDIIITKGPTDVTAKCDKTNETISAKVSGDSNNNDDSVIIKFDVNLSDGGWQLSRVNVVFGALKNDVEIPLKVWAPKKFSFHCSSPKPFTSKSNNTEGYVALEIADFQIEGFMNNDNKTGKGSYPFGEAFDCVGFFSVPIFMGLLFTLLLVISVTFGVAAMASINTPDRFDDPKGPAISVPQE